MRLQSLLVCLFSLVFCACGMPESETKLLEKEGNRTRRNSDPMGPESVCMPPPESWNEFMSPERKREMMEREIFPQMKSMFVSFDKKYAKIGAFHCITCHGEPDQDSPDFTKPSKLYPLDPDNMPTSDDPDPKRAAMVKFMERKVLPMMQSLLRNKELTCFSCHAKGKEQRKQDTKHAETLMDAPLQVVKGHGEASAKQWLLKQ